MPPHPAQVVSGVACVLCALLQGSQDPTLQGLQVIPPGNNTLPLVGALARRQVWSISFILCGLPLHCGAVPDNCTEPGSGRLLPGGKDRGHHCPDDGPPQGLLAASTCLHHGRRGQCGQYTPSTCIHLIFLPRLAAWPSTSLRPLARSCRRTWRML